MRTKRVVTFVILLFSLLVIASCKKVTEKETLDQLQITGAELSLDQSTGKYRTTGNITLPTQVNNFTIGWTSSHPNVLSISGVVIRPSALDENIEVTLTASINNESKTFIVVVLKHNELTSEDFKRYKEISKQTIESYIDIDESFTNQAILYIINTINFEKNRIDGALNTQEIDTIVLEAKAKLDGILEVIQMHGDGIAEILSMLKLDDFSNDIKHYIKTVADNHIERLEETFTKESYTQVLALAKTNINALIEMAKGNIEFIDETICETTSIFGATCAPVFINMPENDELSVTRGFSGDILDAFNIKAIDFKGNDVTNLISINGTVNFKLSGEYLITLTAYDDKDYSRTTEEIKLVVNPTNIMPTIVVSGPGIAVTTSELSTLNLMNGVTSKDGIGIDLTEQIDYIILNKKGEIVDKVTEADVYRVIYKVKDTDDNETTQVTILTSTGTVSEILDYFELYVVAPEVAWSTDIETSFATEPGLLYLMIGDVLDWTPSADDPYTGVGTIPLQPRMTGPSINPNVKSLEAGVAILDVFTPVTAANTAVHQGYDVYSVDYWQYIDTAVAWGGQIASFVIPSRDLTNVAHKNGVPILGNIFMAPTAYGGNIADTRKMLQKAEDGTFPVVDKLLELADFFKFDGWFVNLETDPGSADTKLAKDYQDFLLYFQRRVSEDYPNLIVQNYDSIRSDGRISWQGTLNSNNEMFFQYEDQVVSNSLFIDFRWDGRYGTTRNTIIKEAAEKAIALGRNPYDLYTGFDTQQYGYVQGSGGYKWAWDKFFDPETLVPYTSMGIYRSDWNFNIDGREGGNKFDTYIDRANMFWVGPTGDPRTAKIDLVNSPNGWYGIASFIGERTTVIGDSFHTNFNVGNGKQFFNNGVQVSDLTDGWNNLSVADIQPHYRWVKDSKGTGEPLNIGFDFSKAYYGGNSLKISGQINTQNETDFTLYKTYLNVYEDTKVKFMVHTNSLIPNLSLRLSFENGEDWFNDVSYVPMQLTETGVWHQVEVDLSQFKDEIITTIGFSVSSEETVDYEVYIGQLSLTRTQDSVTINEIDGFVINSIGFQNAITADARLTWNPFNPLSDDTYTYRVSQIIDGNEYYLGTSLHNYLYVSDIRRQIKNDGTKESDYAKSIELKLVALDKYSRVVAESTIIQDWPEAIKGGRLQVVASKTVIKPGDVITLQAILSPITDSITWELEGVEILSGDINSPNIQVKYTQVGIFDITITSHNKLGENRFEISKAITVSRVGSEVSNLAVNGRIHSYSGYNTARPDEHPRYMIDGALATKWCETDATTSGDKWIIVDLRRAYFVSEINVYHSLNDPAYSRDPRWVTRGYKLYYATNITGDDSDWTLLATVTGNTAGTTSHSFSPTSIRYVKLVVTEGSQVDNHSRIQELEVLGRI